MRKILSIDHDVEVGRAICALLQVRGYHADVAPDGVTLGGSRIGLVLLDWQLDDGLSGETLVQELRERCGPVPVVVISADACRLSEASRGVVSDCLRKPFVVNDLLRLIDEYGYYVSPPSA